MRKFIISVIILGAVLMITGTYCNKSIRKDYQLKKYQEEIVNRDKEIRGLEDTIAILIDKIEIYEVMWDVLRGEDSTTIDGLIHYIKKVREAKRYYDDLEYIKNRFEAEPFLS